MEAKSPPHGAAAAPGSKANGEQQRTSNPCSRPTLIMSLQRFGTMHMTSTALCGGGAGGQPRPRSGPPPPALQRARGTARGWRDRVTPSRGGLLAHAWGRPGGDRGRAGSTSSSDVSRLAFLEYLRKSCKGSGREGVSRAMGTRQLP